MQPTRLFDFIHYQNDNYPLAKAFGHRHQGEWIYYSTQDIIDQGNSLSRGLLALGVQPSDKIASVVYKNRPEWVILDLAISQIGAINVPVYPTISPAEYEYIFNDADVKMAFVGGDDLYEKVEKAKASVESLQDIYTFDQQEGRKYWEELFTTGDTSEIEARKAAIDEHDLATLIYTSGTTGKPKGVMLSHHNIASNALAVGQRLPVRAGERALSFLPLCHIFERTASYCYTYYGVNVVFAGTDNLGGDEGDLKAVQPHFFTTVPRLLEKVYEKIYNKGLELSGIKRSLFFWALNLTDDFTYDKTYSGWAALQRSIADKLIFSKWREALGGNVKGILTGAAPCPMKIKKVFSAAGIPIREGYGLTETSPGIAVGEYNKKGAILEAVGPLVADVEVLIDDSEGGYQADEGEILVHGPNVMQGYYNKPEQTAAVFKEIDGKTWFCTGDIGKLITGKNGIEFLKITDRKKELLKTSGGKYVAPAPIENKFKEDFLIEQMMVLGEEKKFVSALIVPAKEALQDWCKSNQVQWTTFEDVIQKNEVQRLFQTIVDKYNPEFSHIEQIKKFKLVADDWSPTASNGDAAELTPTMKLKRRVILDKYQQEIDSIYAS